VGKYAVHRLDANHREIQSALERVGATVDGKAPLDLLVGFRGRNYLLEVKTARGQVRASQRAFLTAWKGHAVVVRTVDEALRAVGALKDPGLQPKVQG